jgi:hypothetical protein
MAIRPRTADPWRGTRSPSRPVSRHRPAQPVRSAGADEDDEAIELRNQLAAGRAR